MDYDSRCVFIAAKLMNRIKTGWSCPGDPATLAITKVFSQEGGKFGEFWKIF